MGFPTSYIDDNEIELRKKEIEEREKNELKEREHRQEQEKQKEEQKNKYQEEKIIHFFIYFDSKIFRKTFIVYE